MKFFFVTYCFAGEGEQALIGVYKRGLRVAMELHRRGHEVVFYCTGREGYQDELTVLAEARLRFVDFPFVVAAFDEAWENQRLFLDTVGEINPDVLVVGEAPLAGAMLEAALAAVALRIPLVILDNAYNPMFAERFCQTYGALADAIVLTGPSSYHTATPPPYLAQVPPYIRRSPEAARALLAQSLPGAGAKLLTVLAYDEKVERVGMSLLEKLNAADVEAVFIARDPEGCRERLAHLPEQIGARVCVLPRPSDPLLFGLVERARLAVVKYGFMQVSECMALRTPVIVVYHEGPTWLDYLPEACQAFAHVTAKAMADEATLEAAHRFLSLNATAMVAIHDGALEAAAKTADFLETMPGPRPWEEVYPACVRLGLTVEGLHGVLSTHFERDDIRIDLLRVFKLRQQPEMELFAIISGCNVGGKDHVLRLWGHLFATEAAAAAFVEAALQPESRRTVMLYSVEEGYLIELDPGQELLPPL